ncbi:hypothetical protein ACFXO9_09670 [Nocardia tengchongensis]|uniref:hypothetical protein n=1 Tax=Nocardia tengchongensis TaxID=2055889 RepID=UPI003684A40E
MFALDHVTGFSFARTIASTIDQTGVQLAQKSLELSNPEAYAAWAGVKKSAEQFQNISSTAGKMLRIRGRLPNLDPHVYGNDGPLSTTRTGRLFNFADPVKNYVAYKYVFPEAAKQLGITHDDSSNTNGGNNSGDSTSPDTQPTADPAAPTNSGVPDIGQLAWNVWQNAVRDVSTFTTPKLTVPTGPLGTEGQVDKSFTITTEWPVNDPLIIRDRRNDAVLTFGRV